MTDRLTIDQITSNGLDQLYTERARAEAALARIRELAADVDDPNWRAPGTEVAARIRLALTDPADDGPSAADCAADDRAHWTQKYAGE
jgi:hypothetical protein